MAEWKSRAHHRIDGERFYSRKFNSMESFLKAHSRYANRYNNIAQKVLNFKSPNRYNRVLYESKGISICHKCLITLERENGVSKYTYIQNL